MIVPAHMDIDRLHATIQQLQTGDRAGRQQGKTIAYLMLMLGEVELGGSSNTYLYIGENALLTAQVAKAFSKLIAREYPGMNVQHNKGQSVIVNDTQRFYFVPITHAIEHPHVVLGCSIDRAFVDIDDTTQAYYDHNGQLTELFERLIVQLSYKRGDVV